MMIWNNFISLNAGYARGRFEENERYNGGPAEEDDDGDEDSLKDNIPPGPNDEDDDEDESEDAQL